jgi:hypothetical protein
MAAERTNTIQDPDYRSYLLRLWRATCDGQTVWRASLESPQTGEQAGFASLEALFDHLRASTQAKGGGER